MSVSLNSTKRRTQSFIVSYFRRIVTFLIIAPYKYSYLLTYLLTLQVYRCVQLGPISVLFSSLRRGRHLHVRQTARSHRSSCCSQLRTRSLRYSSRIAILPIPHLHSTPRGPPVPVGICHDVWYGKTRMVWLPDG